MGNRRRIIKDLLKGKGIPTQIKRPIMNDKGKVVGIRKESVINYCKIVTTKKD